VKRAVILRSETRGIMCLRCRTPHPGLILDGFEDVLNRELQQSEAVVHPLSSECALLRVQNWSLLESTLPATLVVDRGDSVLRLRFGSVSPRLKDELAEFFIASSNSMYGWARYRISLQRVTLYFTRCLYNVWETRSPLMALQLCTLAS